LTLANLFLDCELEIFQQARKIDDAIFYFCSRIDT